MGRVDFILSRRRQKSVRHITLEVCCRCSLTTANVCFHLDSYFSKMALQHTRPVDAGLAEGKLYRLYCKGRMATKFTRPQPTWLPCVGYNASGISQTSKPKTIPELKSALQQIWDDLPQTTINKAVNDFRKRLNKCVSAGGRHFEHMMWTLCRNILTELFAVS